MNIDQCNSQEEINYNRIALAIEYIKTYFKGQPNLDEVAQKVHLSPFHFQRLFSEWAGVSPKKFLQYISIEHAKKLLLQKHNIFETAHQTGLSGTSRLHDLFVKIDGMTPYEFQHGGKNLIINYSFNESAFGKLIIASTSKGICYTAFDENDSKALEDLKLKFPNATYFHKQDLLQQSALFIFQRDWNNPSDIKLHLRGTKFQLKVWEMLLKIPFGNLTTYGTIAQQLGTPAAARAVGTAIGNNPVAFLIPCHRVIQSNGTLGGYMWGNIRKTAIIGWESAGIHSDKQH